MVVSTCNLRSFSNPAFQRILKLASSGLADSGAEKALSPGLKGSAKALGLTSGNGMVTMTDMALTNIGKFLGPEAMTFASFTLFLHSNPLWFLNYII